MAYSPSEKYPGAVDVDPDYQGGKFRDNNPSTTNNGSPLKAIDRNELLARDEAIMNDAGFEYSGVADTPQDSQLFKAYKASLGNGANLLSNHNFLIQTPDDSQPLPSATPTSYPPGYQIFSGVFANETTGITNLTYIDGRVSFSGGDLYFAVSNAGGVERLTGFAASVADFDGKPRTRGVSFALVGDEYRVTVGIDALEDVAANPTPLGSVKLERGVVATGHEVKSLLEIYGDPDITGIVDVRSYGGSGNSIADNSSYLELDVDRITLYAGVYRVASNTNITAMIIFEGGILKPDSGVEITLSGGYSSDGVNQCFDVSHGGSFKLTPSSDIQKIETADFGQIKNLIDDDSVYQNAKAARAAFELAGSVGAPDTTNSSPKVMMSRGNYRYDDHDDDGICAAIPSYVTVDGYGDNSNHSPRPNAKAMDVFPVIEPGANSVIIDNFQMDGDYLNQVNEINGVVFRPGGSAAIYCRIGSQFYIKEFSGKNIASSEKGIRDSVIEPFVSRDSVLGNLHMIACDEVNIGGKYRSAKGASNGVHLEGPDVGDVNFYGSSSENGGSGVFAKNVGGRVKIKASATTTKNGGDNIRMEGCYQPFVGQFDSRQAGGASIYLYECDRADIKNPDIFAPERQGLVLEGCQDCDIDIQVDLASDKNHGVYDSILLLSSSRPSKDNAIGCRVRQSDATGVPGVDYFKSRYALAIDDAACIGNYLKPGSVIQDGVQGGILENAPLDKTSFYISKP